jgi:1-acyl-sn-glycerol-3-phosphate acyltransferase
MNRAWVDDVPTYPPIGFGGWCRVILRGGVLGVLTFGCLGLLLVVRLVERPIFGAARPLTPYITQFVCRAAFSIMGIGLRIDGSPMMQRGAVVSNHASWLDIFALNAVQRVYFVSKSEVAGWAGIGWLARATGTVFIARKSAEAKVQQGQFEARLRAGHRLLFFPEGTSTDSRRVLPFKPTLFAAFYTHGMEHVMHIQPASVLYHAPKGAEARFYGWWGDMEFAAHLKAVLAAPVQGAVRVIMHEPVAVDSFSDRKALSAYCEGVIRTAQQTALDAELA